MGLTSDDKYSIMGIMTNNNTAKGTTMTYFEQVARLYQKQSGITEQRAFVSYLIQQGFARFSAEKQAKAFFGKVEKVAQ